MMRFADEQELSFSMERFTGINQSLEGNDTPMHMSRDAANCDTSGGVLRMARGWAVDTAITAAPGPIRSLMNFYKNNTDGSVTTKLLAATDTGLWQWSGNAWQDIAGSQPVTSGRFSHVNYQNKDKAMILLANGTDNVYYWSGEGKIGKLATDASWVEGRPAADTESDLIRLNNHGLKVGDAVAFYADKGKLPSGLKAYDTYFVKTVTSHTFQVGTSKNSSTRISINKDKGTVGWKVAKVTWLNSASANSSTDLITISNGHGLSQNDVVVFDPWDGSLPGGVTTNHEYYAYINDANTFYITTTIDNLDDKVNITSAGSNFKVRKHVQTSWITGMPVASAGTDLFTFTNHGLKDKTAVEFCVDAGGSIPGGIIAHDGTDNGKYYYIVKATANTFRVSATVGGAPIGLTSNGSKFRVRLSRENRPTGCSLALHAERVWCAGERTRPNSAFFSDDMNPTNWAIGTDSAGEIVRPTWDGDAVTAVANLFDSIVVFKGKSVFRVAGTTPGDYQVVPVLSTSGTLSPLSICQWQNGAFFLSPMGIMAYDGTHCEPLGGEAMKGFWARLNRDAAVLAGACGIVHRGRLLMALPVDGSLANNAVVEFDIAQGSYMVREGAAVSAWLPGDTLRFASHNQVCIWGGEDALTYGGQPISMRWVTPETDFGDRSAWKTVTGVLVTGKGGRLRLTARAQGKESSKVMELPATGGTVKASLRLRGKTLSLMIENVEGSAVELTGLTVLYEREDGQ